MSLFLWGLLFGWGAQVANWGGVGRCPGTQHPHMWVSAVDLPPHVGHDTRRGEGRAAGASGMGDDQRCKKL